MTNRDAARFGRCGDGRKLPGAGITPGEATGARPPTGMGVPGTGAHRLRFLPATESGDTDGRPVSAGGTGANDAARNPTQGSAGTTGPGTGKSSSPEPVGPQVYSYLLPGTAVSMDQETGSAHVAGGYRFDALTGRWLWSRGMYAVYGFAPHEVVPTTSLVLAHVHPEDLEAVDRLLEEALAGSPVLLHYRISDAQGRSRMVLMSARPWWKGPGRVGGVEGCVWDMTAVQDRHGRTAGDEAVKRSLLHRADIEQAKGILMLHYRIGAVRAFGILSRLSRQTNKKLWQVAADLIASLDTECPAHDDAAVEDRAGQVAEVTDIHSRRTGTPRPISNPGAPVGKGE